MAAAEKTFTETGRQKNMKYEEVFGTVTLATTLDWIDLDTLVPPIGAPVFVHSYVDATGVDGEAFFNTLTPDKVFFTQTGAQRLTILAPSLESTGGD